MTILKTLVLSLIFLNFGCINQTKKQQPIGLYKFEKGGKMDEREFWNIVDYSFNVANGSEETQIQVITQKLSDYTAEQIIDFEMIFSKKLIDANDFKIIGAEKIIEGSVSDDSFLYFRCWLISTGRKTFEKTLKSPDSLADVIEKGTNTDLEEFLYISTNAYKIKTGKKIEDDTFPRDVVYKKGLNYDFGGPPTKGENWKDNELPKLYPKLWAKFN
ncbi:DUF4240 domain-containing protein [Mucilaginibacter sp.]|uniref:DUF4240 domain-containing protein n=1 Tax=Mucilaginibacter sp. TaxID=1882438 RepID=UPI003D11885F